MKEKIKKIYPVLISVGLLFPLFSFAQSFNRDLYLGLMNNPNVSNLQEFLTSEGLYSGPITGNFFSLTLEAVKKLQIREGISPALGYFGAKTRVKASQIISSQTAIEEKFLVSRVIDGDTIELSNGKKVRYIGMDTPETVDPRKPVQCFGVEASNRNKQLVEGKNVRLEKDISDIDKYGRLLRYVYVDGVFVNLILVQEGFAYSSTYPPDVKYQSQFTEAERLAREQKIGLWGSCPISASTPIPIPIPLPVSSLDTNCTIKGNISSSREKIYHVKGCVSYNVTKIDEARGESWFCTEREAVAAGWRKAKNCPK